MYTSYVILFCSLQHVSKFTIDLPLTFVIERDATRVWNLANHVARKEFSAESIILRCFFSMPSGVNWFPLKNIELYVRDSMRSPIAVETLRHVFLETELFVWNFRLCSNFCANYYALILGHETPFLTQFEVNQDDLMRQRIGRSNRYFGRCMWYYHSS